MDESDMIVVNVEVERKVYATRVDMYVDIKGESFVSGSAALKKAREVRDLVAALAKAGIEESNVEVMGIRASVASGIIAKSSSAVYRLRIDVPALDMLADAIGAVTSRKNASLGLLDWKYPEMESLHEEMLGQALERAEHRAALICRAVNHRNLGVHGLTEKFRDTAEPHMMLSREMVGTMRAGAVTSEDLGLDVTHAKTVSLDVRVEYRVEPQPVTP